MQTEFRQALQDLQQARQNFDNADQDYIDVAIFNLAAAESRVNAIRNKSKRSEEGRCSSVEENFLQVQLQ